VRFDAGDREGAFASLLSGIDPITPKAASVADKAAWARALAAGGQRDDAVAVLRAIVGREIPADACALAVELFGADARPFVEAALDAHLELVKFSTSYDAVDEGTTYLPGSSRVSGHPISRSG